MKKLYTLTLVLMISLGLAAQDYSLFHPTQKHYFRTITAQGLFTTGWHNPYSWSTLKVTSMDSSIANAGTVTYYPFRTWRDTSMVDLCGYRNGPGWMGSHIIDDGQQTILFNESNDTVLIRQSGSPGDNWRMMNLPQGQFVEATVDNVSIATVASITDSVKQISLKVYNANLTVDSTHLLNNKIIRISKNKGLFTALSFRDLPAAAVLERIDSFPSITMGAIFDYNIGDEFEYRVECRNVFGQGNPPSFVYTRIVGKFYSPSMETLYYIRNNIVLELTFNSFPMPHLDSTLTFSTDTVSYTNLYSELYSNVPEENGLQRFVTQGGFGVYSIDQDSSLFNNRRIYIERTGFYYEDTCLVMNHFEPVLIEGKHAPGLGVVAWNTDYRSIGQNYCQYEMIWFRKGSETWGNYLDLTSTQAELSKSGIRMYPNPASSYIHISTENSSYNSLEIFSASGALLNIQPIVSKDFTVDLNSFPPGMLIFRLTGKESIANLRVMH